MATDHPKAEILAQIARRKELIETSKKLIKETKNLVEQSHRLILIAMGHDADGKGQQDLILEGDKTCESLISVRRCCSSLQRAE